MWLQWVLRIAGYGATMLAPWLAQRWGIELGTAIGGAGGWLLNKATTPVIPRAPKG